MLFWPKYLLEDTDSNEIIVAQSGDGWVADVWLAMTLQIDCTSSNPRDMSAAVAFSDTNPDNSYNEDLWVVCNNNNGNGPYIYPRILNVNGLVTGLSRTDMAVDSSSSASDSDCEDEANLAIALMSTTVVFGLTTALLVILLFRAKLADDEMRKTLNTEKQSSSL